MLRSVLSTVSLIALISLGACSDIGANPCAKGGCGDDEIADPPPRSMPIDLGCIASAGPVFVFRWELTVDPGPILNDEPFGARFSGLVRIDEFALDEAQGSTGGFKRANVLALKATVHVREGVTNGEDVVLTLPRGGETCAYDEDGNARPTAGPEFPTCSPRNDTENGNTDCIGLGGVPDFRNPCGQFVSVPTSDDRERCEELGKIDQWVSNGFCITGDAEWLVEGLPGGYIAANAGRVLFGWDDESTSAILDSTRPQDPIWSLTRPEADSEPGPNSLRVRVRYDLEDGGVPIATECTMASGSAGLLRPTPDSALISFSIPTR